MTRVTALHPERRDRVRVELDGKLWRTLPATAVASAGLFVGTELDRARARELGRALRRSNALGAATSALARRDRSTAGLRAYLGDRGADPTAREQAVETLARYGYLDDARFAAGRAASLARRGFGDDGIRFDLVRQGLDAEQIAIALGTLEPEADRARAVSGRSHSVPTAARRLAAKGFSPDAIESALGVIEP
jgi:regulatory protein